MLSLATHEPNFKILREDVFAQGAKRGCHKCGQPGHHSSNCQGLSEADKQKQLEEQKNAPLKPFIFLDVSILREYLQVELNVPGVPFFDLERAIDDWVFMIFFVGNDFLPHLPSLDIREGAIDMLLKIWRDALPTMGGYLTNNGRVELARAQIIMDGLAEREDEIFRKRKEAETRQEQVDKEKRRRIEFSKRGLGSEEKPGPPPGAEVAQSDIDYVPVLKETKQYRDEVAATAAASASEAVKPAFVPASNPASAVSPTQSAPAAGGPPKPKNPMFLSSRASGTAPIRNNFGLGSGRTSAGNANKSSNGSDPSSLMGSSQDVVANRAAIRKANLSAAEMLKAELAGKTKQDSPTEEAVANGAAAETASDEKMDGTGTASTSEVDAAVKTSASEDVSTPAQPTVAGEASTTDSHAAGDDMVPVEQPSVAVEQDGTVDAVMNTPPAVAENVEEDVPASAVNGEGPAMAAEEAVEEAQDTVKAEDADAEADPSSSPSKGKKRTADEAGIPATRTQAAIQEAKEEEGSSSSSSDDDDDDEDDLADNTAADISTISASMPHVPKPLKMLGGNMVEQEDTVQ